MLSCTAAEKTHSRLGVTGAGDTSHTALNWVYLDPRANVTLPQAEMQSKKNCNKVFKIMD